MAAQSTYHIASLLEKMTSADKDYRFMATNDLMSELQKDSIKLDDDSERKVVRMLLRLLEDKNGEVQNLAVKCLGPLVNKVKDPQAETIVDTLCLNLVSENELLRDVSSVAMKTVISELPPTSSTLTANVVRRVTPKIIGSLTTEGKPGDVSAKMDALDILADIILRYGPLISTLHSQVQEALLPQLSNQRLAVGKRAIVALSHLVAVCNNALFDSSIEYLVGQLKNNSQLSTTRTYVAAVASVSKASGHRFGEHLHKIFPLLIVFCEKTEDDELRESCLQAFEAFIFRCPKEAGEFLPAILKIASKYIAHDPNYHYGDDEEENGDDGMNGDMETDLEDEEEDDGGEYSDDDDMSWKVRRASAKTLEALILSRRDLLPQFYREVGPLLISRFKEREENVKSDIFHAYVALLRQTKSSLPRSVNLLEVLDQQSSMEISDSQSSTAIALSNEQMDIAILLRDQIPSLTKAINKQLREKSLKTRQSCFALLSELLIVIPGALREQMSLLVPGIETSMTDKLSNSNMKIDTLSFLGRALSCHDAKVFYPHVASIVPLAIKAARDPFYKVAAEALGVIQVLARVLRPLESPNCDFDFTPYVNLIYGAVFEKLKATDIDQEVKERAIAATGQLICAFGDYLNGELRNCLPILLERLKNEMTRLTTVKALTIVAQSPLKIDLKQILPKAVPHLADFLRKNQRVLKLNTLYLLETLVSNYTSAMSGDLVGLVLDEIPALVSEADLQISQLSLRLVTGVLKCQPEVVGVALPRLLDQIVLLNLSPLLHGSSLASLREFLSVLTVSNVPGSPTFNELLDLLVLPVHQKTSLNKQAYHSIAKCVATLVASKPAEAVGVTNQLGQQLKGSSKTTPSEGIQLFSLLALGEIGRLFPDVYTGRSAMKPEQLISQGFQSPSEEIKTAASYSLGGLAVGNLEKYLPFILKEINADPKRQYLLLHALKEVIGSESVDQKAIEIFKPRIGEIWKVLMDHAQCAEEGTRNVVAECIGKLCLMDPITLLPMLKEHIHHLSPIVRTTVVTAVKFTVVDQPQAIDPILGASIGTFLEALKDEDLNVRRVALITFNSAAHNKPSLVRDLLDSLLPSIYLETKPKKELVKEVEMGPFKHTVDGGLDLRKAAFECMYTLLESCLERLDIFEFLNHVEDGLRDHYDIKLLTYLMLSRLAVLCPSQVLQRVSRLVEPLKATCNQKVKANAVKQEFEKQEELKRSALRAVFVLQAIPDADKNPQMSELLSHIRQNPDLNGLYQSVERDPGSHRALDVHAMEVDV